MNKYCIFLLLVVPGIALATLAFVLGWVVLPSMIHSQIIENIRIMRGTETWTNWVEAPIPIYLTFHIHHITNPDEVENGLKPAYEEKGPYVYLQKKVKVDIHQDDGLNTVKYKMMVTYFFLPELSGNNTENDLVNIPNIPFLGVVHTIGKMFPLEIVKGLIGNYVLFQETLIRRDVPVGELLFKGFNVTKYTNSILGRRLPKEFAGGRFGLYKGKNGTASEEWEIFTGYENFLDFGRVKTWNGNPELGFWQKYSDCDKLKGTDGTIFHPFITKQTELEAFAPDVCRSLPLTYDMDVEYMGIHGYRFKAKEGSSGDPRTTPETQCFCLEEKLEDCPHAGMLPLESCTKAPIWMSAPYFLDGDMRYVVESGLEYPQREKHETFIDVEPTTGLILRAHKRIQIGLEAEHSRKVRALQKLTTKKVIFPLIWADESAELDEAFAEGFKSQLLTPLKVIGVGKWVLLVVGILLFILGLGVFIVKYLTLSVANTFGGFAGFEKPNNSVKASPPSSSQSRSSVSTIG